MLLKFLLFLRIVAGKENESQGRMSAAATDTEWGEMKIILVMNQTRASLYTYI